MRYFEMFAGVGGFGIGIQRAWNATNAENQGSSTSTEERARSASESTNASGGQRTGNTAESGNGNTESERGVESLNSTETSAPVAGKQSDSSSRLSIRTETERLNAEYTGQDTAMSSKPSSPTGTKSSATTATTQRGDTESAPICVGFSEIDPHASAVLRYHYPNIPNHGDCTKINWSEVPDFDLLVGGSPCQDFSIAGKRAGLVGARSGLAYEYIRALEEKHPARFIWENVRGVLSSNRGWDFAAILNQMAQAGYSLQWQVLNAKFMGVPQNRERVFVIGTRSDLGSPGEVFFDERTVREGADQRRELPQQHSNTLRTNYSNATSNETYIAQFIGAEIRRLMPVECERLMSWPDGHTSKGKKEDGTEYEVSDTQRYKMCGNGVVSEVVKAIVEVLYKGGNENATDRS